MTATRHPTARCVPARASRLGRRRQSDSSSIVVEAFALEGGEVRLGQGVVPALTGVTRRAALREALAEMRTCIRRRNHRPPRTASPGRLPLIHE
jgi:hypothetical protein